MLDINVVFILFDKYKNYPVISDIISQNLELLKPTKYTILTEKEMDELGKQSKQFELQKKNGCFASDEVRLLYLQENPYTLYLDADSLITSEFVSFIQQHRDDSFIFGWPDPNGKSCSMCTGTFCYRGAEKSILFDKLIEKYEQLSENEPSSTYTDIQVADFLKMKPG